MLEASVECTFLVICGVFSGFMFLAGAQLDGIQEAETLNHSRKRKTFIDVRFLQIDWDGLGELL